MARSVRLRRWQKQALDLLGDRDRPGLPGGRHARRRARRPSPSPRPSSTCAANPGRPARGGGADQPPQAAVGARAAPLRAAPRAAVGVDGRPAARPTCTASSSPTSRWRPTPTPSGAIAERCLRGPRRAPPRRRRAGLGRRASARPSSAPPRRLALSGTPFRCDTHAIPFVQLPTSTRPRPTTSTATARRCADGRVVRPVYFPRIDGFMEWVAPDGARARRQLRRRPRPARARPSACAPRCQPRRRVAAGGAAPRPTSGCTEIRQVAARRRRARHRHRPGARPRHRRPAAPALPGRAAVVPRPTTRRRRPASPTSPRATTRGSSPCAWCRRASTSPACASACSPPRPPPSCSSARPSAGSCAGHRACRRQSGPGCSSPTTRACAPGRPASPSSAATRLRPEREDDDDGSRRRGALDERRRRAARRSSCRCSRVLVAREVLDRSQQLASVFDDDPDDDGATRRSTTAASPIELPLPPPPGRGPLVTIQLPPRTGRPAAWPR